MPGTSKLCTILASDTASAFLAASPPTRPSFSVDTPRMISFKWPSGMTTFAWKEAFAASEAIERLLSRSMCVPWTIAGPQLAMTAVSSAAEFFRSAHASFSLKLASAALRFSATLLVSSPTCATTAAATLRHLLGSLATASCSCRTATRFSLDTSAGALSSSLPPPSPTAPPSRLAITLSRLSFSLSAFSISSKAVFPLAPRPSKMGLLMNCC